MTIAGAFALGLALAYRASSGLRAQAQAKASALAASLDAARREGAARERLLAAVVDSAPMAILLLDRVGRMLLTNTAANDLFFEGRDATGENLLLMLGGAPAPFRDALLGADDTLFTVDEAGAAETYHMAKRTIDPGGEALRLVLVRPFTRELHRQELAVWKKLLRVLSHEMNSSLAAMASLAHSARRMAQIPEKVHRLEEVCANIEERSRHLKDFIEGYARLARLPEPRRARVAWRDVLDGIRLAHPAATVRSAASGTGYFDRGQIEQVIGNLVRNAEEASHEAAAIGVDVEPADGGWTIVVRDRGPGMSADVLKSALLPFYSTKDGGTGLGLALAREIVEAHGGRINLKNREGGGLEVACFISDSEGTSAGSSRLTITRA